MNTLRDLLVHELKDLYSAERQLLKALPKMVKASTHDELRQAFENHLEETHGHAERLEKALTMLNESTRGPKCAAMQGLIEEAGELLKEESDPAVKDAALIAAAQRIEHYEMAGYGCARAFANQLGETRIARMLQETLDEESAANELLTSIAENTVNVEAMAAAAV